MKNLYAPLTLVLFFLFTCNLKSQAPIYWEQFDGGANGWVSQVVSPLDSSYWNWSDNKWKWVPAGLVSGGAFFEAPPNPTAIGSETAANGAMVFNADFYTTQGSFANLPPGPPPYVPFHCHLISPPIDLSGVTGAVRLEFNHYLRFLNTTPGAPPNARAYVSWSVNGGATWLAPQIIGGNLLPQQYSPHDEVLTLLMPGVEGTANFRLRFSWSSDFFFWAVDDIKIIEQPAHDMRVNAEGFAVAPNRFWPLAMAEEFSFLASIQNVGGAAQTNVTLTMSIEDSADTLVYTNDLAYGTVAPGITVEEVPFTGTGFLPASLGLHTATYTVSADSVDANPADNSLSFTFDMTETLFAKENGVTLTTRPGNASWFPGEPWAWAYGNYFYVPQGGFYFFDEFTFALTASPILQGEFLVLRIYEWDDLNGDALAGPNERIPVATMIYDILGTETSANPITLPVENLLGQKVPLNDDTHYIAMVEFPTGIIGATVSLGMSNAIDYGPMILRSEQAGNPRYASFLGINGDLDEESYSPLGFGTNFVPAVRVSIVDMTPLPVSAFTASETCGFGSLEVSFTDLSENEPTSWSWDFGNGQTSEEQNPATVYDSPGVYTVSLITSNVGGNDTLVVSNYITVAGPVEVVISPNDTVCGGQPATLQASGASNYIWTGQGLNSTTGSTVVALPAESGQYTYTVAGFTNACPSPEVQVTITVRPKPMPVIAFSEDSGAAINDGIVCEGDSVALSVGEFSTYLWLPGGYTTQNLTLSPAATTTYQIIVTDSIGCGNISSETTITVIPFDQISASLSDDPLCLGDTLTLTASGAEQYIWNGLGLFSNSGSQVQALPNQLGTFSYLVAGESGGCQANPVLLTVDVLQFLHSSEISVGNCPGPDLLFTVQIENGGSSPLVQWYLNGDPVSTGPAYTLVGAKNGDEVYCISLAGGAPPCTTPAQAQSNLLTIDCIETSVIERPGAIGPLALYPNPNEGVFTLETAFAAPMQGSVSVFDALGRRVWRQDGTWPAGKQSIPVALHNPASGLYWVVLEMGGETARAGVVVGR